MGVSKYWRNALTGLKKCSERTRTACTDHDDCCAVVQCSFCLEFESYDGTQYGLAEMIGDQWFGSVAGAAFHAYWKRDEYDVCNFIVTLDGEEVYREPCGGGVVYGGISCRDSSDEAEVTIDYEEGTLRWIKVDKLPLPHIADPEAPGCKTWFCGECECTCLSLCVSIDQVGDELGVLTGEAVSVEAECPEPHWTLETSRGYTVLNVDLALERDPYTGGCLLVGTINGEEVSEAVDDCSDIDVTVIMYDGSIVIIRCKQCDCLPNRTGCCPNLGNTLYLTIDADYENGVITLVNTVDGETAIWDSVEPSHTTVTDCNTLPPFNQTETPREVWATVSCGPEGLNVAIGSSGRNSSDLFSALFPGCNGGTLCDTDPEVATFRFGGSCKDVLGTGSHGCVTLSG